MAFIFSLKVNVPANDALYGVVLLSSLLHCR